MIFLKQIGLMVPHMLVKKRKKGYVLFNDALNTWSYFSFQPVLHDWCNKGRGMCYPVCGMVHVKEPMMLIGKSSPCGDSGFPLSLSV